MRRTKSTGSRLSCMRSFDCGHTVKTKEKSSQMEARVFMRKRRRELEVVAQSAPHHSGYAHVRGFCWHDAIKALLARHYTYHHLQQSSTSIFHSPLSVLTENVVKLLVNSTCQLISAKLPTCQLVIWSAWSLTCSRTWLASSSTHTC